MKKILMMMIGAAVLMSSCDTYQGAGAYTGSMFGNMVGSAIGGIAGGWRGHEIGSLIGTVGGAAIGAAVGQAADERQERRYEERASRRQQRRYEQRNRSYQQQRDRGYDRSYGQYPSAGQQPQMSYNANGQALVIRNAAIYEENQDGRLTRGEKCSVVFEIANTTSDPVTDVYPLVDEKTGNKHIHISPNMRVESIAPHQAIRYTASLVADSGLKDGQIEVLVGVAQGNTIIDSQTRAFQVPTSKR